MSILRCTALLAVLADLLLLKSVVTAAAVDATAAPIVRVDPERARGPFRLTTTLGDSDAEYSVNTRLPAAQRYNLLFLDRRRGAAHAVEGDRLWYFFPLTTAADDNTGLLYTSSSDPAAIHLASHGGVLEPGGTAYPLSCYPTPNYYPDLATAQKHGASETLALLLVHNPTTGELSLAAYPTASPWFYCAVRGLDGWLSVGTDNGTVQAYDAIVAAVPPPTTAGKERDAWKAPENCIPIQLTLTPQALT